MIGNGLISPEEHPPVEVLAVQTVGFNSHSGDSKKVLSGNTFSVNSDHSLKSKHELLLPLESAIIDPLPDNAGVRHHNLFLHLNEKYQPQSQLLYM